MDTIDEYLSKTESASIKLFEAAETYLQILHEAPTPFLITNIDVDETSRNIILEKWQTDHGEAIEKSNQARKQFTTERFAYGVICGSILQVAAMAIQLLSTNKDVHPEFKELIKPSHKSSRFSIGREVRGVPIGLIIYAGRNQYNHLDDDSLNETNITVFNKLALNWTENNDKEIKDPAFDLENELLSNYSVNVIPTLGWGNYESFYQDLFTLLKQD